MNKISQKRDLDDKNTIFQFAKKIESLEQLKLLFIFTVADMKATGPVIWNTWNKYPLEQLFLKTRSLFLGSPINLNQKMLNNVKAELSKKKIIHKKNLDLHLVATLSLKIGGMIYIVVFYSHQINLISL